VVVGSSVASAECSFNVTMRLVCVLVRLRIPRALFVGWTFISLYLTYQPLNMSTSQLTPSLPLPNPKIPPTVGNFFSSLQHGLLYHHSVVDERQPNNGIEHSLLYHEYPRQRRKHSLKVSPPESVLRPDYH
jgi:hypothetical protein